MYPDQYQTSNGEYEPCGRLLRELMEDERGDPAKQLSTITATLIHEMTHCILESESIHGRMLQLLLTNRFDSRRH